jgi:hypothetical protein
MRTIPLLVLLIVLIFEIACEGSANLRIPAHEPKLVVNAQWSPGGQMWVHLSRSYATSELINRNDLLIPDAKVELWEDGVLQPTFKYFDTSRVEPSRFAYGDTFVAQYGQYMHPNLATVKSNAHYQLKIVHPEYPDVVAECRVPSAGQVEAISINFDTITVTGSSGFSISYDVINVTLKDTPGEENFYGLSLIAIYTGPNSQLTDTFFTGGLELVESYTYRSLLPANTIIFDDRGKDGERISAEFFKPKTVYSSRFAGVPEPSRYIFILYSMNEALANYHNGIFKQRREQIQEDFLFATGATSIKTNIEGGYGVFGVEKATVYVIDF